MLDDSGQPMSSQYIVPCLQDQWRKVWGLDGTFLAECGAACPTANDYVFDWMQFLLDRSTRRARSRRGSWAASSRGRATRSSAPSYGFGANDCTVTAPIPVRSAEFEAGLLDFRSRVQAQTDLFGTYYAGGSVHTFLLQDSGGVVQGVGLLGGLYDTQVNGVRLVDWISDLLAHNKAAHVGP